MQSEPGHRDIEWRKRAQDAHTLRSQPNFFVGFPKGRLFEGLARFNDAAREGDLPSVTTKRVGSKRQEDVGGAVKRKEQEQAGGVPNVRWIEPGRPVSGWSRRDPSVGRSAGERPPQPLFKTCERIWKKHRGFSYGFGTTVIGAQPPWGMGYALDVAARTTSAAMNAYPASLG